MKLYGLKTCDTCRKALKQLPKAEYVDVRQQGVPGVVLETAFAQFGSNLINTRSTTWRGLSEAERQKPGQTLLDAHPTLMKRPLIQDGQTLYLGWGADTKTALGVA